MKQPAVMQHHTQIYTVDTLSISVCASVCVLLLQDLAVSSLRESKVHQLIQQLVDNHKVILNALLLQLFEVLCEHLHDTHKTSALSVRNCQFSFWIIGIFECHFPLALHMNAVFPWKLVCNCTACVILTHLD